jgi:hypothetical protein
MKIPTEIDPNVIQIAYRKGVLISFLEKDQTGEWVSLLEVAANLLRQQEAENVPLEDRSKQFDTEERETKLTKTDLLLIWNYTWNEFMLAQSRAGRPTKAIPLDAQLPSEGLLNYWIDETRDQVEQFRRDVEKINQIRHAFLQAPPLTHSKPRISEIIFTATFVPSEDIWIKDILPDWMDWINRVVVTPEMPLWVGSMGPSVLVKALPDTKIAIPPKKSREDKEEENEWEQKRSKIRIFLNVPTLPDKITMAPNEDGTWQVRWEEMPSIGVIALTSRFGESISMLLSKSIPGRLSEPSIESFRNTMYIAGPVGEPTAGFYLEPISLVTVLASDGYLSRELELRETKNLAVRQPSLLMTYHPPLEESLEKLAPGDKNPGMVDFTLAAEISSAEMNIEVGPFFNPWNAPPELQTVTTNLPSTVNIVRLEFRTRTEQFRTQWLIHILPILSAWVSRVRSISGFLERWIPPAPASRMNSRASSRASSSVTGGGERNIALLRAVAPKLFLPSVYGKDCPGASQPVLIQPNDISHWERPKRAIHFRSAEPDHPGWYFGCPNAENPYIGIKQNKRENNKEYPVIPCCYPRPHDEPGGDLDRYVRGESFNIEVVASDRIASTQAILAPSSQGKLPPDLAMLLSTTSQQIPNGSLPADLIHREGVEDSPSSAVHAISRAMRFAPYFESPENARERWVTQWRLAASQGPLDMVLGSASSKYGSSERQLREELADPTKYLDPSRWAPLLEWYFQCQLYLFEWQRDQTERFLPRQSMGGWVPRKLPIYPSNVLLLVHRGGTINSARPYPQCEIVAHPDESGVWNATWTTLLTDLSDRANSQLEILVTDYLRRRINFTVDPRQVFQEVLGFTIIAQSLDADGNGKAILFTDRQGNSCWMLFPPFAALPCPIERVSVSTNWDRFRGILPRPDSRTPNSLHWILGTSVLVPEASQSPEERALPPFGSPIDGSLDLQDQLDNLAKEERQSGLLFQIMIILMTLYAVKIDQQLGIPEDSPGQTTWEIALDRLFGDYVVPDDQAPEVTFRGMLRQVPYDDFDKLFQLWDDRWSSIVGGKIHLLPLLATKLKASMLRWIAERRGTSFTTPLALDRFYLRESDFDDARTRSFRVFFSVGSYERYLRSLSNTGGGIEIKRIISISTGISGDLASPRPFVYTDGTEYCIIQPCIDGLFQHAIQIALMWREQKINPGFRSPALPVGTPLPSTIVRKITETNQLTPLPPGSEHSLQLLMDLPGHFSAILPL